MIDYKKERGEAYAYYAYAEMMDGSIQCEIMTKAEVEKVRQGSRGRNSTPWTQHFNEMAKKTCFRRLAKWLPMQSEVTQKLQEVETKEFDFDMPEAAPQEAPKFRIEDILNAFKNAPDLKTLDEKFNKAMTTEFKDDQRVKEEYMKHKAQLSNA